MFHFVPNASSTALKKEAFTCSHSLSSGMVEDRQMFHICGAAV